MGTTVTLDMEDHPTVDSTLGVLPTLRKEHPGTGAVLQAMLFRTEDDAARPRRRAAPGCGWSRAPTTSRRPSRTRRRRTSTPPTSRCLQILMAGPGYPMVGSHDPR